MDFTWILILLNSNILRISHLKVYLHRLEKRCFSLYTTLLMILQLGGVGNIIGGITTAVRAADDFVDAESVKGKFIFWYQ